MITEMQMRAEFSWEADPRGGGDYVLFDALLWREATVGQIECFHDAGPWYGRALGERTGAMSDLPAARRLVEDAVIAVFFHEERTEELGEAAQPD